VVLAVSPATVNDWEVPLTEGFGSPLAWVAEVQLEEVIEAVEYLMS
jgi:ribosomal protein L16/L10AE